LTSLRVLQYTLLNTEKLRFLISSVSSGLLVDLVSTDSERRLVVEVQQAIDLGWDPVWESFGMVAISDDGYHKMIFAIMMPKYDNSGGAVSEE
jgi:hypothetical protein